MGDRIAVLREGGHLAQFATPAELLMDPADDFVEDFVGADRALKRLALMRVSDIDLWEAPLAFAGQDTAEVRAKLAGAEVPWALLVDSRPQADRLAVGARPRRRHGPRAPRHLARPDPRPRRRPPRRALRPAAVADPLRAGRRRRRGDRRGSSRSTSSPTSSPPTRPRSRSTRRPTGRWPERSAVLATLTTASRPGPDPRAGDRGDDLRGQERGVLPELRHRQHRRLRLARRSSTSSSSSRRCSPGFVVAMVLAIVSHGRRWLIPVFIGTTGVLYTIPSIALFLLLLPITGRGTETAMIALSLYNLQIIYRNANSGLANVPASARDSGTGMGMTKRQLLWKVELPLAAARDHRRRPDRDRLDRRDRDPGDLRRRRRARRDPLQRGHPARRVQDEHRLRQRPRGRAGDRLRRAARPRPALRRPRGGRCRAL